MKYRTDDLTRWGVGEGRDLNPDEVDINFWTLFVDVEELKSAPAPPPAIDHFEVVGLNFFVHFVDDSVMGPYELPVANMNWRGDWVPETDFFAQDTFTANGKVYITLIDHETETTFDENANNGLGDDYYAILLEPPGVSLPTGGAVGQVLTKSDVANYATTWGWKTPTGGSAGQYHRKVSSTQDDSEWSTITADEVEFEADSGSLLSSGTLNEVLEEIAVTSRVVGRQTMWLPASAFNSLLTDGASPGVVETSTYKNLIKTMDFDADDREGVQFEIAMPKSWDKGDLAFRFFWSHTGGSDYDVKWEARAAAFSPDTDFDLEITESVSVVDTGGDNNTSYVSAESAALTTPDAEGGSVSEGSLLILHVFRAADDVLDTLDVDARLHGVQLFYNLATASDD